MLQAASESNDRINELPDCILLSILSLLTLKDAVTTSMLCRRWRNLWKDLWLTKRNLEFDIPNIFGSQYAQLIDIHEEDYRYYDYPGLKRFERQQFVSCVNSLLGLYLGNKVDSFKVAFFLDGESTKDLDNWVRFAITKGAQVLHLHLRGGIETVYHFPYWILTESDSSVLKHLSLEKCALSPSPKYFDRFNELKTLWLDNVTINTIFMAHLFSVCVTLESLTLKSCSMGSTLVVAGEHPGDQSLRLQELKLLQCYELEQVAISAVNLTSLEFEGNFLRIYYFDTPRLESVFLCARAKFILPRELTIFASFPELETLNLSLWHGVALLRNIPTFANLRVLDLDSWVFDIRSLVKLLMAVPLLEELVLTVYASHLQRKMRNLSGFSHDHLKNVKFQRFHSNSHMIELAICILEIATKLETMVIYPLGKLYVGGGVWREVYRNENEDEYSDEEEDMYEDYDGVEDTDDSEDEDEDEEEDEDDNNDEDGEKSNSSWEDRGRKIVQEKLNEVMSGARIIINSIMVDRRS
ncbi:putative F-box domain, FBD domain, leucine-rich repeat domain, L domain-containing protein [Rosa chinensis]|uniref:Putative F-box domain, FBD domain, leucine-rich repeat domain, L domain-containing protein n=1 Tax=Rosa chinensis TaxID=74649 RepID=A0A2P6S443_ROSCH|nr:putative F-box domain, FBD domain, leucine-rich repeat domain, L domain-containing protein [Rosa chinensis]